MVQAYPVMVQVGNLESPLLSHLARPLKLAAGILHSFECVEGVANALISNSPSASIFGRSNITHS